MHLVSSTYEKMRASGLIAVTPVRGTLAVTSILFFLCWVLQGASLGVAVGLMAASPFVYWAGTFFIHIFVDKIYKPCWILQEWTWVRVSALVVSSRPAFLGSWGQLACSTLCDPAQIWDPLWRTWGKCLMVGAPLQFMNKLLSGGRPEPGATCSPTVFSTDGHKQWKGLRTWVPGAWIEFCSVVYWLHCSRQVTWSFWVSCHL